MPIIYSNTPVYSGGLFFSYLRLSTMVVVQNPETKRWTPAEAADGSLKLKHIDCIKQSARMRNSDYVVRDSRLWQHLIRGLLKAYVLTSASVVFLCTHADLPQ
jgi:hypothetical protein